MIHNNNNNILAENPRRIPDQKKLPSRGVRPLYPLGIKNMCNTMNWAMS